MRLNEGIVDSDDLDIGVLDGVAEDDTANTTETVDANLDGSHIEYCKEFVFCRAKRRSVSERSERAGSLVVDIGRMEVQR